MPMKDSLSWREYTACIAAHGEYHSDGKEKAPPMTQEQLEALGIGETVIVTDFKGGK